jgi:PII-like signaling protein
MTGFYTRDEPIYELGNGIYGKVLDCVWQYIQKSDDKDGLQKILKLEMEDNIGMCAQGNLSRIVNIMAGYFDEIKISEPFSEVLGRRLPALIEIDDNEERLDALIKVYNEVNLPRDVWVMWAEPLFDDMTVELRDGLLVVH